MKTPAHPRLFPSLAVLLAVPAFLGAAPGEPTAAEVEFFEKRVRPLLSARCYKCHSAGAEKLRAGLLLDSFDGWSAGGESGPPIIPGDPEKSLLIEAVRYENKDLRMPPGGKLSDGEIETLVAWVRMGAPDPRRSDAPRARESIDIEAGRSFWAFRPPVRQPAPAVRDEPWPRSDIDRFVLARLEAEELTPVGDADRGTLLRRVTFDLTGLPPTPAETEAFLGDDSPRAFEKVVDRLLGSRHFGERWGRHWLDVARYAESTGMTRNFAYPHAWRYRDWVIDALNRDLPYDRFIAEQIAGDLLPEEGDDAARRERLVATGFLAMGIKDLNERNMNQFVMDVVDEQIDVVSRGILALTVSCARCHDHKFDPIPTTDYYALAGIFRSTETLCGLSNRGRANQYRRPDLLISLEEPPRGDSEEAVTAAAEAAELNAKRQEVEGRLARAERRLRQLRLRSTGADRKGKNRRAPPGRELAELRREVRGLQQQLDELNAAAASGELAMGVRDSSRPADSRVHVRGEVTNLGAAVARGLPRVLAADADERLAVSRFSSGRLELARWLASPENPLTARVAVNRIWHHLFGRGIVATVDNFGETGVRPTHPELLDHLALRFVENGWSVKTMIREIVLSRVYGLSSGASEKGTAVDPDNRLLWRMSQRRLEVEAVRDAMLAVSGRIDLEPPAGSLLGETPNGELGRRRGRRGTDPFAADSTKRTVYLPVVRGLVPPMLEVFDFADPSMLVGSRDVTTVATQALYLLNSPFVREQSRAAAERLLAEDGLDARRRVERAYLLAFGRPPAAVEADRALAYIEETSDASKRGSELEAWSRFCQALFASAEFRYVN